MSSIQYTLFKAQVDSIINNHKAITHNRYTSWFSRGDGDYGDVKDLILQLSIFSNDLNIALLYKMNNSNTRAEMHGVKQILMNELGVIYRPLETQTYDPDNVGNFGTVDGGKFKFKAAHYEWLADTGEAVGLQFNEMGRTHQGNNASQKFSEIMIKTYSSLSASESDGANYGLKHWGSSGFWTDLITGFAKLEQKTGKKIPIGYFKYHGEIEPQHTAHTEDNLLEIFNKTALFISGAQQILHGLDIFWNGLCNTVKSKYSIN